MISKEIRDLMNKFNHEYTRFDDIPAEEKLAENDNLCAMLFLYNHLKDKKKFQLSPAHDIIYFPDVDDLVELTEEDILYLVRCGVHYNSEYDCFAIFT